MHEYDGKLNRAVDCFVGEEVRPRFSELFDFIAAHEPGSEAESPVEALDPIISKFNETAVAQSAAINTSIMQAFSDYQTAVFVVNVLFTQLLTAYQRFLDIHDAHVGKNHQEPEHELPMSVASLEQILRRAHPNFTSRHQTQRSRK